MSGRRRLTAGAATDIQNHDGDTSLDLVRDPWSDEIDGLYFYLGTVFRGTWASNESGRGARRNVRFFRLRADLARAMSVERSQNCVRIIRLRRIMRACVSRGSPRRGSRAHGTGVC
jgi:hypothetical protein